MQNTNPLVSVIIPVFNDAQRLSVCLAALKSQDYPKNSYEVIVVDNGSTDDVASIVCSYGFVMIKEDRPGSYAARNCGIRYAKGDIIAFTDSDCIPNCNWIATAIQHFKENSNVLILSGKIVVIPNANNKYSALLIYDQNYHFNQRKFSKVQSFSATANLFCKKSIFNLVGFFNEDFYSFGDVEFGRRLKSQEIEIAYNDQLIIKHPQLNNLKALWNRSKRLAGGSRQLRQIKRNSEIFEWFYLLFLIAGTPFIILNRFFYRNISCVRDRVLFAWVSFIVHVSKCSELFHLLSHKKTPERK